jgi:thiamine-monophosphate kinase
MRTRITSEGELIERYLAPLARPLPGTLGLRDDAARLSPPPGYDLVISTDAVAEGVHFFADDDAAEIAWKALAVNVSDVIAKGAEPWCYQMALSFPEAPEHAWMAAFAAGLADAQSAFGITLSGGDTDRRSGPLSVTITAIGTVPTGRSITRSGAQAGDRLFVTGDLGASALGLRLRRDASLRTAWALTEADAASLLARYLRPQPPIAFVPVVRAFATASMDISDGLAQDLGKLCRESGVGARVEAERVPLSAAARRALDHDSPLIGAVLGGGDDYEVLLTIAPDTAAQFVEASRDVGVTVTDIGQINATRRVQIADSLGRELQLEQSGWEHFR